MLVNTEIIIWNMIIIQKIQYCSAIYPSQIDLWNQCKFMKIQICGHKISKSELSDHSKPVLVNKEKIFGTLSNFNVYYESESCRKLYRNRRVNKESFWIRLHKPY